MLIYVYVETFYGTNVVAGYILGIFFNLSGHVFKECEKKFLKIIKYSK